MKNLSNKNSKIKMETIDQRGGNLYFYLWDSVQYCSVQFGKWYRSFGIRLFDFYRLRLTTGWRPKTRFSGYQNTSREKSRVFFISFPLPICCAFNLLNFGITWRNKEVFFNLVSKEVFQNSAFRVPDVTLPSPLHAGADAYVHIVQHI